MASAEPAPVRRTPLLLRAGNRILRDATAAVAFVAAGALAWRNHAVRDLEARATERAATQLLGLHPWVPFYEHDVLLVTNRAHAVVGIQITPACTSAVFLLPLTAVVGVLLCLRRLPAVRVLFAAAVAGAVMCATDLARLVSLIAALAWAGHRAFAWMHVVVGTWMSMLGAVAGLMLFCRLLVGRWWPARTPHSAPEARA
ncbi:exosortase/archaeosortase family protein [Kitasatospora sp. LaBMicrA B282]|uniref:exosortase/archaeosortase family protein n=1 Tax=Kitasatospora sp. LaBMicrA B282 TaxID=3420949 RepID=UPI003D136524